MPGVADAEEPEESFDLLVEHAGLHLAEPPDERQVLRASQVGVQVGALRHVPDPPPVAERETRDGKGTRNQVDPKKPESTEC